MSRQGVSETNREREISDLLVSWDPSKVFSKQVPNCEINARLPSTGNNCISGTMRMHVFFSQAARTVIVRMSNTQCTPARCTHDRATVRSRSKHGGMTSMICCKFVIKKKCQPLRGQGCQGDFSDDLLSLSVF